MAFFDVKARLSNAADLVSEVSEKAKEYGDKAAVSAKEGVKSISEKAHEGQRKLQLSYYNPIFPEQYAHPDFDLPKMIVIVDEDERKGIEICDGAMGWLSKEGGCEVLHLYEEAVCLSGLSFHPMPTCDSVYYMDAFDSKRLVNLSCFFEVMQQDKMTELRNIAYSLGAKQCRVETFESAKEVSICKGHSEQKASISNSTLKAQRATDASLSNYKSSERKFLFSQTFEGNATPKPPQLRWYAHDGEILSLIEMRCSENGGNSMKDYSLEIDCSTSSTMSATLASKIDIALKKLGATSNFSLEGEVMNESRRKLLFSITF
ncbi:hypothetical protein [Eggerthella sinensis]|uniref:hypothetical protein n=1 Tax=Eggerthella sinensis TaxID=242230 RepID=UPI00266BB955|nr:hypothetical protein [Eggerthella sinensis]